LSAGEDEGAGGARHYFWSWVQDLLTLVLLMVVLAVVVMMTWSGSRWFWFGQICRHADQNCRRAVDSMCRRKTTTMYTNSKIPGTFEITDTTTVKMMMVLL
jgi:ABC-type phosphate transport system auxiliary subunit